MWRDEATILDILKAARRIIKFKDKLDENAFLKDVKTQSSVVLQLLVIGEAVKRLSKEFRDSHNEIPWKKISGMRDRLIHLYDEIDIEEVWKTANHDIPQLIEYMEQIAPEDNGDPE